jgi:hypothetical protein
VRRSAERSSPVTDDVFYAYSMASMALVGFGWRRGLGRAGVEFDLTAVAVKAYRLVPAGAIDHVKERLAVQVPAKVLGE